MFTDRQKLIYKSPAGTFHDPLAVERRLRVVSKDDLDKYLIMWEGDDDLQSLVAEENLVDFGRTAFGFEPLTESGGVSEAVVLETLTHYLEWLSFTESADATLPTSPPCTEPQG